MAVETGGDTASFWGTAIAVALSALGILVQQFLKGRNEESKPSHYVIEQAEIADMTPMRAIATKLEMLFSKLDAREEKLAEMDREIRRVIELLREMESKLETERRVQEALARRHERERDRT